MNRSTIVDLITYPCVTLFLYAGVSKLMDYDVSREQLGMIPILANFAQPIALILPIIEILTAIILFLPRTRRYGLIASLILMLIFTVYIIYLLTDKRQLPCTCGGVLEQLTWAQHLALNFIVMAMLITAIWLLRHCSTQILSKPIPTRG